MNYTAKNYTAMITTPNATRNFLQVIGGEWTELTSIFSKTVNINSTFNDFISIRTISFSFELKVNKTFNDIISIFRITNTSNDFGKSGDRVPAVFINANTKLFVAFDTIVNNNFVNYGTEITKNNLLNENLLIQGFIENNNINIFINGTNVLSNGILYNNPSISTNLIINDSFHRCNGGVFIKNFVIYNYIINPGQPTIFSPTTPRMTTPNSMTPIMTTPNATTPRMTTPNATTPGKTTFTPTTKPKRFPRPTKPTCPVQ
jgi:hypothetical protein